MVFLRKIKEGRSSRSYGIDVAKLSGLPKEITDSAQKFMNNLSSSDGINLNKSSDIKSTIDKMSEDKYKNLKSEANNININELTPIEAINKLNKFVEIIGEL